jgi:hypothetical protein
MTRGVGIAKRGFGRALSRIGYSEGTGEEGVQPMSASEGLENEIEGLSGIRKIKEKQEKEIYLERAKKYLGEPNLKEAMGPAEKIAEKIAPSTYEKFRKDLKEAEEKYKMEEKYKNKTALDNVSKKIKKHLKENIKFVTPSPGRGTYKKGGQAKVGKVMREFKAGKLHSGKKGPVVKSRKQAIAIALSEAGMSKNKK